MSDRNDWDGYWGCVLGANRDAADVVREFELVDGPTLDTWLYDAEEESRRVGGLAEVPAQWDAHHDRALALLRAAIAEAAS